VSTNKVAILVSGTYRETDFLLNVFPQITCGVDCDIYFVLRHTSGEVSRLGDKESDFKIFPASDNVFMCELPSNDEQEIRDRYLIPVGPTDDKRECAILSMFHGVFTAISMMKSSLRKYDYVMKTRTDYLPPMTIPEMLEENQKTGKIIVDGCASWARRYPDRFDILWQGSLNDIFCFATTEQFLKLWDFDDILQKVWTGIPETTLFRAAMVRFMGDDIQSPRRNDSFLKKYFTWDSNDTKQSFHVMRRRHGLPKPNEATYFKGDDVVKYFVDKDRVKQKVERAALLEGFVPKVNKVSENFFTYKYIEGDLLSDCGTHEIYKFLDFMQDNIWKKVNCKCDFISACRKFYQKKTNDRISLFTRNTNIWDQKDKINGKDVLSWYDMSEDIDWKWLCSGIPVLWHGDPQPENVIVTPDSFCLIDWRENFGGTTECGDVYYDLAKIYHALIVSGKIVREGKFVVKDNPIEVSIEYRDNLMKFKDILEAFILDNGYDLKKVKILSALIYLNIAALHEEPYNKFLYYFGREYLSEVLYEGTGDRH